MIDEDRRGDPSAAPRFPDADPTSPTTWLAVRGSVLRVGGFVLGSSLGLVSTMLLIRHLGVEGYGRYLTIISLLGLLLGVGEAGLGRIAVRQWLLEDAPERTLGNVLGMRLVLTAASVLAGAAFAVWTGYGPALLGGVLLGGISLLVTAAADTYGAVLEARLRFGWLVLVELGRQVVTVVAVTALVLAGAGLLPLFAVMIPAGITGLIIVWIGLRGGPGWARPRFEPGEWRRLWRVAGPNAGASILGVASFNLVVILLSIGSTSEQTGLFSAAFRIFAVLSVVVNLAVQSFFPLLVRSTSGERGDFAAGLQNLFDASLVLGAWLALGTWFGAPLAIRVVAGPGFEGAVVPLRILGLATATGVVAVGWNHALLSLGRAKALLVAAAIALTATLAGGAYLMPRAGAAGAALTMLVAGGAHVIALALPLLIPEEGPDLRLARALLVAPAVAVAIAAAWLPVGNDLLRLVLLSVAFLSSAWLVGLVPAELKGMVLGGSWRRWLGRSS